MTSVPLGSTVHDKATVTGVAGKPTPTGDVTFDWFTNGTCANTPAATSSTFGLTSGSVDATTFTQGPLAAGSYSFKAHYAGDTNYFGADGPCEPLTVTRADPTIGTTIHATNHSVIANGTELNLGSVVHDTAQVGGAVGSLTPTGAVTFTFYTGVNCATGSSIGTNPTAEANGDARSTPRPCPGPTGSQPRWPADRPSPRRRDCEPFSVKKASPTIGTTIHATNHSVIANGTELNLGSVVHDTAQVGGAVGSLTPTGAVTFTFYTGVNCATGSSIGTNPTAEANGDARCRQPSALTPGSYGFTATVAADTNFTETTRRL